MKQTPREEEQVINEIRAARSAIWRHAGSTPAGLARLLSTPPKATDGEKMAKSRRQAMANSPAPTLRRSPNVKKSR